MDENIDKTDDASENLEGSKSEMEANEDTASEESQNIVTIQETENMEVHHHSHAHGKRNWKSYIWEFVMLFLAVFCGFLAEYQLEHKIEGDREIIYMENMIGDLKKDTQNINTAVSGNRFFLAGLDTLLDLLANRKIDNEYQRKLFIYSMVNTYYYMPLQFSELTISQLKYSGNFRLIKNHKVANGILQYEQGINACKSNYDLLLNYFHIYEATNKELFNMSIARKAFKAIEKDFRVTFLPLPEIEKLVDEGKYLENNDLVLLSRYYDDLLYYQTTLSNVVNITSKQKTSADSLIQLIRNEYHISD